jgi:hypothetical protein
MMTRRITIVPATLHETEIIKTIDHWFDLIGQAMTGEAARRIMQDDIARRLKAGTLGVADVIAAAEAGHQDADLAMRSYAATFIDQGREAELLAQERAFVVKALLRQPVTYPRGTTAVADTWTRDIGIALMVGLAAQRWIMPPTRGRKTTAPAAACFVSIAACKRGFKLKEQQVSRIYQSHHRLAARLAASLKPGAF